MADSFTESFKVAGHQLLDAFKRLVHEGNVRRVIVKDARGVTVMEVPLTVGLVGAALIPVWTAIGAIAALAADFTIQIERKGPDAP